MKDSGKNILFTYRRYTILVVLIFSSAGLFINTMQEWGMIEWWIRNFIHGKDHVPVSPPEISHNIILVIINVLTIVLYLVLMILILTNKIGVQISTIIYGFSLSAEIFFAYNWYLTETDLIPAYVLRDLILFNIIIFVIATSANTFFTVLFSVTASVFYMLISFLSGNVFLIENIPVFIMLIGSFAFVFRKIIIILEKNIEKREEESERIQQLSRFKENMSYMLIHDIKVPLNSIIMLSTNTSLPPDSKKINYQAMKATRMLGNIIDVESGNIIRIKPSKSEVFLNELIDDATDQVYYHTLEKNITIKKFLPEEIISINADRNLLERCLVNIIENAVKYSPPNDIVDIHVDVNNHLKISVTDYGPGIPKDQQERIFELYYTLEENKQDRKSSGIGLTFCKMVINAHEGKISVKSDDKETTFILSLPSFEKKDVRKSKYTGDKLDELSEETLTLIQPLAKELKNVAYYQTGEIYKILNRIPRNGNTKIENEIEHIRTAALSCNEKMYSSLLIKISR